jgi:hypothetical protein
MNNLKQVMVVKPNTITDEDKEVLAQSNIIVIECENPDDVKLLTFYDGVRGDDFLMSLIKGVAQGGTYTKEKFCNELFERLCK